MSMYRTGFANISLHNGKAPIWLNGLIRQMAKEIASIIIEKQGTTKFIARLSDLTGVKLLAAYLHIFGIVQV
jgi:hypothetical protein